MNRFAIPTLLATACLTLSLLASCSNESLPGIQEIESALQAENVAEADSLLGILLDAKPRDMDEDRVRSVLLALAQINQDQDRNDRQIALVGGAIESGVVHSLPVLEGRLRTLRGEAYWRDGDFVAALADLEIAIDLLVGTTGEDRVYFARACTQRGIVAVQQQEWDPAEEWLHRAEEVYRDEVDANHPDLVKVYNAFAYMFSKRSRNKDSARYFGRALECLQSNGKGNSEWAAFILSNQADVLVKEDSYDAARPMLERSIAICDSIYGPGDVSTTNAQINLADIYLWQLDFPEAEKLYRLAHDVRVKNLKPKDPLIAWAKNGLGNLKQEQSKPSEALPYFQQALAIMEAANGEDHSDTALLRNNLGRCYLLLGMLDEAEAELRESSRYFRENVPDHWDHGQCLSLLGRVLQKQGRYQESDEAYRQAVQILGEAMRKDHWLRIEALVGWGDVLLRQGELDAARDRLTQALSLAGPRTESPGSIAALRSLGDLERRAGRFSIADSCLVQARDFAEDLYGFKHIETGRSLYALANLRLDQEENAESFELAQEATEISNSYLEDNSRYLPEEDAAVFIRENRIPNDVLARATFHLHDGESTKNAWDLLLGSRRLVFNEQVTRHRLAEIGRQPEYAEAYAEYMEANEECGSLSMLGAAYASSDGRTDFQQVARKLEPLEERRNRANDRFARKTARVMSGVDQSGIHIDQVKSGLSRDAALVAYYRYDAPQTSPGSMSKRYLAFVWAANEKFPEVLDLGESEAIDDLVADWRDALKASYSHRNERSSERERYSLLERTTGRGLYDLILAPLEPYLQATRQLHFVLDGPLALVNLSALPTADGRYVIENGKMLQYLSSERDLARDVDFRHKDGMLLIGNPDYGRPPDRGAATVLKEAFRPLRASTREMEAVERNWSHQGEITQLEGLAASESEFKRLAPQQSAIHLSTHGFFLQPDVGTAFDPTFAGSGRMPSWIGITGLALAGANLGGFDTRDDGLLTAREIALLELNGCELAVLSACQSGVGLIRSDEGVYGLQRAFLLAGVRTVIMSLWDVEDSATALWMAKLYENRYSLHLTTAEAAHQASLDLIADYKELGRQAHPYEWGAFVAIGDWR